MSIENHQPKKSIIGFNENIKILAQELLEQKSTPGIERFYSVIAAKYRQLSSKRLSDESWVKQFLAGLCNQPTTHIIKSFLY